MALGSYNKYHNNVYKVIEISSFHHIFIITNIIIVALRSYNKYHNNNNNAIMTRTP